MQHLDLASGRAGPADAPERQPHPHTRTLYRTQACFFVGMVFLLASRFCVVWCGWVMFGRLFLRVVHVERVLRWILSPPSLAFVASHRPFYMLDVPA